jgi:enamine deaminase RidA (YjgF/YER057c/UK114 family)
MAAEITIENPASLGMPLGQYSQVARVKNAAETIYVAGMLAVDRGGKIVGEGDVAAQTEQVFANIAAALQSAGMGWGNVVQFTTYLVDAADIAKFMDWRKRRFPTMFGDGKYPPNTLLVVSRLVNPAFRIEVQTVAAR